MSRSDSEPGSPGKCDVVGVRYGVIWRLILPTLLLASVFVPLRAALTEVAWKIRVREEVTRILRELAPDDRSVRTTLAVEPTGVRIQLALIGSHKDARLIEQELKVRVAAVAGMVPQVDITAVPDDVALRQIAELVAAPRPAPTPLPAPTPTPGALRKPIEETLAAHRPVEAGEIQSWQLDFGASMPTLQIQFLGEPLGRAAARSGAPCVIPDPERGRGMEARKRGGRRRWHPQPSPRPP